MTEGAAEPATKKRDTLYVQVLVGIALGVLVGWLRPHWGEALKPLGDTFVAAVKMLVGPIVFVTVVLGIAGAGELRRVGRVGLKALVYFEGMSTLALVIGLGVVHWLGPGRGIHARPTAHDLEALHAQLHGHEPKTLVEHLTGVVPDGMVTAFTGGDVLQVLFVAVLFGIALAGLGDKGEKLRTGLDGLGKVLFRIVALVMRAAPLGAFGAMAYTVGHFGLGTLANLFQLMLGFYATALVFVVVCLGTAARVAGVSLFRLLRYLRHELLLVLGTSSSETVLPQLMDKLEHLGASTGVVRLVIPTGYSFNLDGTSIYLTMAAVFVAQATDTRLSLGHEIALLAVLLLTSKGAAAVTGGGFITLTATLQSTGTVPVGGLALLLGIDRFMSEARAIVNMIGNAVATLVVARWEGELDVARARRVLAGDGVE